MPHKICPQCETKHGVRKQVCDCGHDFACKKRSSTSAELYPEPGSWVLDITKGMPEITSPGPLPPGKVSPSDVKDCVSYDGLGYCIYSHIPAERIADTKLRRLWQKARLAMRDVFDYLETVSYDEQ